MEYVIIGVVVIILFIILFTGKISYKIKDDSITLRATYWFPYTILYSEIISVVELEDSISYGIRLCGLGNLKCGAGLYRNHEFGNYILYSNWNSKRKIKLVTKKNKTIIIGLNDNDINKLLITLIDTSPHN